MRVERTNWSALLLIAIVLTTGIVLSRPPIASQSADDSLRLYQPDLSVPATFMGRGGLSADGLGQLGAGGTLQAEIPGSSFVEIARLYAATLQGDTTVLSFAGQSVALTPLPNVENPSLFGTSTADVTGIVRSTVGTGGGVFDFSLDSDPTSPLLNGVALVVIYSNHSLPVKSISIFEGGLGFGPATTSLAFGRPVHVGPKFEATLALGIQHGWQGGGALAGTNTCGTTAAQYSIVDVNGTRLTSCAGNFDDGYGQDGALITVGGVGDSFDLPTDPFQIPGDGLLPRVTDDELYEITGFISDGDTALTLTTTNPSADDSIFLAIVEVTGETSAGTTPEEELAARFAPLLLLTDDGAENTDPYDPEDVRIVLREPTILMKNAFGGRGFDTALACEWSDDGACLLDRIADKSKNYLDLPGGSPAEVASEYEELKDLYDPVTYTRIVSQRGFIVIQYWFYYYYNNFGDFVTGGNYHEGDWEMISLVFAADSAAEIVEGDLRPVFARYSQHVGGARRVWGGTSTTGVCTDSSGMHPLVFVARGSHASYFAPGHYSHGVLPSDEAPTLAASRNVQTVAEVLDFPGGNNPPDDYEFKWIYWDGKWGTEAWWIADDGPHGPAEQGGKWRNPLNWANDGDLDDSGLPCADLAP